MKKILAVLLAIITASALCIPAFAEENIIENNLVDSAVETAVNAITDENIVAFDGLDWLIYEVKASSGKNITAKDVSNVVSGYVFFTEEEAEQLSDNIVEDSRFFNAKLDDGTYTIFIGVKLYEHPELFNYKVFRKTMDKLYEEQFNHMMPDREYNMMTYRHIAGEMALHQVLYIMLKAVKAEKTTGILNSLYNKARIVDLNVNEDRIPPFFIKLAGFIITTLFDVLGISKVLMQDYTFNIIPFC